MVWNRDVLAAINIMLIAKAMSNGLPHPYRGEAFGPPPPPSIIVARDGLKD
jgi:hypothetical protein